MVRSLPVFTAIVAAIVVGSAVAPASAQSNTIHLTQNALAVRGPDKQTAHDNAYAQADNTMRLACAAAGIGQGGSQLQNEQEDNTSYSNFGPAGWMANILLEADCVINGRN